MKLTTNKSYIFFNFIGWILLYLSILSLDKISYSFKDYFAPENTALIKYFLWEGFVCGLLGFIISFIPLYFIDKKKDFSKIYKKELWQFIIVFIISQVIYNILLWPLLASLMKHILLKDTKLTLINKLTNTPFFATTFLIWLFIVLTLKFVYYIKEVKLKQVQLEASLKESQLNTLKGQVNPHFMFNSLNNIRGLILEDTNKSREMITRLSEMLRYSLTKNDVNAIELSDELEMVDNYVAISKIQMEERLLFEKTIDVNLNGIKIPPMIIQMLVENATKHGISNLKNGGIIKLNIKQKAKKLLIEVCNSGKLSIDSKSTQLGLKNIQQRLALLYKGDASFNLEEKKSHVVAKIQIPLS
jgi:two-component system, LytTR family, sensor kinase